MVLAGAALSMFIQTTGASTTPPTHTYIGPPPKLLRDVRPQYPNEALSAGFGGTVVLEAKVDADGNVTDVRVLRGIPLLNEPAMAAVRRWKYQPVVVNGEATGYALIVNVGFSPGAAFRGYDVGAIARIIKGTDADASGYASEFAADHAHQFKRDERKKLVDALRATLTRNPGELQASALRRALRELEDLR
jgi:TonB family protein